MSGTLDVEKVEKELGIKLPSFFTEFHRQNVEMIGELRLAANDFDYIVISSDADWMIQHNRDFLRLPREVGLCRNKICIGTDGCGNDSFISIVDDDPRVFFIDHEIAEKLIDIEIEDFRWEDEELNKFSSLTDYVKYYIEIYQSARS